MAVNSISATLTQIANVNNSVVNVVNNSITAILNNTTTINNVVNSASEGFMDLGNIVSGIDLTQIGNAIGSFLQLGMDLENTQIRFEGLLGSSEKANKVMADISQYAGKSPYNSTDLQQNAEMLLKTGIAGDKVVATLKMLGDVSGGSATNMETLTTSFAQMSSNGSLMGDQLNQMISAGFNPLKVISENTGISLENLNKHMEAGAISTGMVEEAFRLSTAAGGQYHNTADRLSESAGGKWSIFMDKLSNAVAQVSLKFTSWIAPLMDIGIAAAENIVPFVQGIQDVIKWITSCEPLMYGIGIIAIGLAANFVITNASLAWLNIQLAWLAASTWVATAAQTAFNFVMSMNPVALIVMGILALGAAIYMCWERFAGFRGVIMAAWEVLRGFGTMIYDYVINRFRELLTGITGIGQALMHFFNGDFAEAWEAGQNAASNLMGIGSTAQLIEDAHRVGNQAGAAFNAEFANQQTPEVVRGTNKTKEKTEKAQPQKPSSIYDSLLKDNNPSTDKSINTPNPNPGANASSGIIGGGAKATNITINLGKMQDQIVINTINAGEGASSMRQLLEEELNRLLGSVAAMQTT